MESTRNGNTQRVEIISHFVEVKVSRRRAKNVQQLFYVESSRKMMRQVLCYVSNDLENFVNRSNDFSKDVINSS